MILRRGDSGNYVLILQRALKALGISVAADGVFGPGTEQALKIFQGKNALVTDGVLGPNTEAKIRALLGSGVLPNPIPGQGTIPSPVPSGKGPLKGLDIYHDDEITSWDLIAENFSFISMKATQGLTFRDNKFIERVREVRKIQEAQVKDTGIISLLLNGYHFMEWDVNGQEQARYFKRQLDLAGLGSADLPPECDWEYSPARSGRPSDAQIGRDFLEEISQLTGRLPIVYINSSVPGEVGAPSWLQNYYLWIASYRPSPKIPAPWSHWTFWQESEDASLPGLGNKGDSDLFNGDLSDLKKL